MISPNDPPLSNTGVVIYNIDENHDKHYSIDWLRCTTGSIPIVSGKLTNKGIKMINELLHVLKSPFEYDELRIENHGINGYKSKISVLPGITIYLNGPVNKFGDVTTMLEISGEGCDVFQTTDDWFELLTLIKNVDYDFKSKRIDMAIDDFYGKQISGLEF